MANWIQERITKSFDQKNGQTKITETWKKFDGTLDLLDSSNANAFDRVSELEGMVHTYTESYYEDNDGESVSIRGSISEEPLETHPMFQEDGSNKIAADEWESYRDWQENPSSWNIEDATDNFKLYWKLRKKGVTSFLSATIETHVTKFETRPADSTDVGTIQSDPACPSLDSKRNWLLYAVSGTRQGTKNLWLNTYVYKSSGANGWDVQMYKP
jgi:hypothetical protein